jgi:hypothetical protein
MWTIKGQPTTKSRPSKRATKPTFSVKKWCAVGLKVFYFKEKGPKWDIFYQEQH